jgi:predicted KAP-like P-loop ATPase
LSNRGGLFLDARITTDIRYYARQAWILSNVKAEKGNLERKTRFVGRLKQIAYQSAVILEWLTNMRASKKRPPRFDNSDYATSFQNAKLLLSII